MFCSATRIYLLCLVTVGMLLVDACDARRRHKLPRRNSAPFQLHPDRLLISDDDDRSNATHDVIDRQANEQDSHASHAVTSVRQGMHGKRRHVPDDMIVGSKRAITIAKMDYLRKNWCKTEKFVQVIRVEGCLKRKITNRFCYGQCNSFFIPKMSKSDKLSAAFENCATCKPKEWDWVTVTLRCPGKLPNLQRKRIKSVKRCKCMSQNIS